MKFWKMAFGLPPNAATMACLVSWGNSPPCKELYKRVRYSARLAGSGGYWEGLTSRCLHNCIGETQELCKESVERSGRDWVGETMHTRTKSLGSGLAGFWS